MSITGQLSLTQWLCQKKEQLWSWGEGKCSLNVRQRWSPLSVSTAVSDLKLSIDLIPPRTGLHIKPLLRYSSSETGKCSVCVCVNVQARGYSPGLGYYQKKKVFRVVCCPLIVIQTLRSPAQRLPRHTGLHFWCWHHLISRRSSRFLSQILDLVHLTGWAPLSHDPK